jgi:hypothetical protein
MLRKWDVVPIGSTKFTLQLTENREEDVYGLIQNQNTLQDCSERVRDIGIYSMVKHYSGIGYRGRKSLCFVFTYLYTS